MARPVITFCTALYVLCASPAPTWAQVREDTREARAEALDLFEQAEVRYQEGDFSAVVELLTRARQLHRAPVLLYNLARAYEGLGEAEAAVEAYEQYLEEEPGTPDRGAIERRLASLRTQIADRDRLARERTERDRELEEERRRARLAEERASAGGGAGPWPYVVTATGVVMLGGALGVGFAAVSLRDEAAADPEHRSAVRTFDDAETLALVTNVLLIVGGVATAAGLTWLLLDSGSSSGDERLEVRAGLLPGGLFLAGTFDAAGR